MLVAALGPAPAFGLNAASFLASVLTLWRVRLAPRPPAIGTTTAERPLEAVGRSLAVARRVLSNRLWKVRSPSRPPPILPIVHLLVNA